MGCSNSKSIETNEQKRPIEGVLRTTKSNSSANSSQPSVPKSVAFEVSLQSEANGAAASPVSPEKKSLPKRLLDRLQDEAPTPEQTAEQILEKQRKAEERRLQVLDERQNKARASVSVPGKTAHERVQSRMGERQDDEDDERLRTPAESPAKVKAPETAAQSD